MMQLLQSCGAMGCLMALRLTAQEAKGKEITRKKYGNIMEMSARISLLILRDSLLPDRVFAKDGLKDFIKEKEPKLLERVSFENCSTSEKSGVNELLKRGVVAKVAGDAALGRRGKAD